MWGVTKLSSKDNKFFNQINTRESVKNSQTSVWKLGDSTLQTYKKANPIAIDQRSTATTVFWRFVDNEDHFKIQPDIDYYFTAGYRFYEAGTNRNTGVAKQLADSSTLSFRFDSAQTIQLWAEMTFAGLLVSLW